MRSPIFVYGATIGTNAGIPMIVYGLGMSPFVRKVMVAAGEKGIAYDLQPVGLGSANPDFLKASPFGKMPALSDGDFHLADSTAIVVYFESIKPAPALIPAEPHDRAKTIWFDEFADTILVAAIAPMFFNRIVSPRFLKRDGDLAAADRAEAKLLPPALDYIESVLDASGHLVGGTLTLADIAVASPLVNLGHLGLTPDAARYPRVAAFIAALHSRPSFAPLIAAERQILAS